MGSSRPNDDAVFLIQVGGRILSANSAARQLFHLKPGQPPDLERLSKRAQPPEAFLELCAGEARKRFSMDGYLLEGISTWIPEQALGRNKAGHTGASQILLTLRLLEIEQAVEDQKSNQGVLPVIASIGQSMAVCCELEKAAETILRGYELLVVADVLALTIFEKDLETKTVYSISGLPGPGRQIRKTKVREGNPSAYIPRLIKERQPLMVSGDTGIAQFSCEDIPLGKRCRSYSGFLLAVGDEILGAIELGSLAPDAFTPSTLELVRLLAGPAGIALRNIRLFEKEHQESRTTDSLIQLITAAGSSPDLEEILPRIIEALIKMIDVSILGFLVFDEKYNYLESRNPFHGFPVDFLPLYKVEIKKSNPAEALLRDPKTILTEEASEDVQWKNLGLDGLARAASLHDSILVPVVSGGHILGYLQASNHRKQVKHFDDEEQRILGLAASLAAPALAWSRAATLPRPEIPAGEIHPDEGLMASSQTERIRDGLEMAVAASRQGEPQAVLSTLANEMLILMGPDAVLVAEKRTGGPILTQVLGSIPVDARPETLFGQRNPLRQVFDTGEMIQVADLYMEAEWNSTPLLRSFHARGIICLPLVVGSEVIAAVLAIFSQPLPSFSDDDRQIYQHLARQVAIVLQNLNLLEETRKRLREVNQILDFSRQLSSLNQQNILEILLTGALQAIPASSAGMVSLWNDSLQQLEPQVARGYPENNRMLEIKYSQNEKSSDQVLPVRVIKDGKPQRVDEINFAADYSLPADDLLRYQQATGGRIPNASLLVPIKSGETPLGLLVLDNFKTSDAFDAEDEALAASLAQQTALALDNARHYDFSEQRAGQLQALTQTARVMTSSLQQDELVRSLLDQLQVIIPFETAALWMREGPRFVIVATSGRVKNEKGLGYSVAATASALFNQMTIDGQAQAVCDMHEDPRFDPEESSGRLSWLGLPLMVTGELIGVITLEKHEGGFYSEQHIQIGETFAGQAAIALENARLYEESQRRATELDRRSQRLALLNRLSSDLGGARSQDEVLRLVTQQVLEAFGCSAVSAVLINSQGQAELTTEAPEFADHLPLKLPEAPLFSQMIARPGIFISGDVEQDPNLVSWQELLLARQTRSLLVVPMLLSNLLQGILLLHTNESHPFTPQETELALTIGNQAAVAIHNARLTQDLEQRVRERTIELSREQKNREILLGVITALSSNLEIDKVLDQTLNLINAAVEADQSVIFLVENGVSFPYFRSTTGRTILAMSNGWIVNLPEIELAELVLNHGMVMLINDLSQYQRWKASPGQDFPYLSVIGAPLSMGHEILGVLVLYHDKAQGFQPGQLSLIEAVAGQISVALHNANLFNLVRSQAKNLSQMLHTQEVETSRSHAILEAVADGVLVTDASNVVSMLNPAAERYLDLKAERVVGKNLDQLSGLLGSSGQDWTATILRWSNRPADYRPGETYSDQISLENGCVIAISLAPVFLDAIFLGTVSVFRDITIAVKVDQMKSEFVANVSHELRTPMTSIKGFVDLMLMGASGSFTDQQTRFLEVIKNNTRRLNVLVNGLLDVSRIEAGQVELSYELLDIAAIAMEIMEEVKNRAGDENKSMEFVLEASPNLPFVEGDPLRVRQILTNLITNAYNYTPENGRVTVHIHYEEPQLQIDVEDNGVGISKEEQERIFERFYRGEHPLVLATSGTGLGLSIVKTLVEMHHGQIWFSSSGEPGKGSVFSFTLPLHPVQKTEG